MARLDRVHGGGFNYERILAAEGLAPVDDGSGRHWVSDRALMAASRDVVKAMPVDRVVETNLRIDEHAAAVDAWRAWAARISLSYPFRKASQRMVWKLYASGVPMREIPLQRGAGDLRQVKRTVAHIKALSPQGPPNPWYRGTPTDTTERKHMGAIRTLHYDQIAMHRPVKVPGAMNTDVFNAVDGTPHAGGIDVEVKDIIVLVTWGNIKSATRRAAAE